MNQKVLARTLQEPLCDPHLDFGRFVGTNSFLAAAYWSEFPGATDLTHPGPPPTFSSRGGSCFPLAEGQRQRALGSSRPAAGGLCPLRFHAGPGRKRHARARSQRSAPATTPRGLTCRSPETAALPRPPPRVLEVEVQDPPSNGAAGNWPLDFLRPDPDWDRPVGGAAKLGLPPSCFRLGGELRVGVRVQGPGRDVGRAGGGCGGSFALVPSRGGHGAGGRMVWRGRPRKPRRSPLCEPRRARTHQGRGEAERGPQGPLAGSGSEGRMYKGKRKEGTEMRMAVECCVTYNFRRGSGPERRTGGLWLWTITTFFVLMAKTLL